MAVTVYVRKGRLSSQIDPMTCAHELRVCLRIVAQDLEGLRSFDWDAACERISEQLREQLTTALKASGADEVHWAMEFQPGSIVLTQEGTNG